LFRPDPLAELGKKYRASLPRKRVAIDEAWRRFSRLDNTDSDSKALSLLVHRLAGSGATYGYIDISEFAIRFEEMLDAWVENRPQNGDLEPLQQALEELLQIIDRAHAKGPDE
jgi:HPt (histidine-containing phosphotransfer) domain-containing protein